MPCCQCLPCGGFFDAILASFWNMCDRCLLICIWWIYWHHLQWKWRVIIIRDAHLSFGACIRFVVGTFTLDCGRSIRLQKLLQVSIAVVRLHNLHDIWALRFDNFVNCNVGQFEPCFVWHWQWPILQDLQLGWVVLFVGRCILALQLHGRLLFELAHLICCVRLLCLLCREKRET